MVILIDTETDDRNPVLKSFQVSAATRKYSVEIEYSSGGQ